METRFDERSFARDLVEDVVARCPRRFATSPDEARGLDLAAEAFGALGFETRREAFRFNASLYANLALHFGLASVGTLLSPWSPWIAFVAHALAGLSYVADSTRRGYLLRRLMPWRPAANLLAVLPARGIAERRIVICAHVDAAFTGLLFHPRAVRATAHPPFPRLGLLRRPLALATGAALALALLDGLRLGTGLWFPALEWILTLPCLIAFLMNAQIVLRDEVVPGANDDLSGVAALPLLARRLSAWKPDPLELVFVVTSAEEASLGGSDALCRAHLEDWPAERTAVIALDGLCGGTLRYFGEGELLPVSMPLWLRSALEETVKTDPRFASIGPYRIPAGASDAAPFLFRGYPAVGLGCVDDALGTPRHYHLPSDTPENLDDDELFLAVDFVEALVKHIVARDAGRLP